MTVSTTLCNEALGKIGANRISSAVQEKSNEAEKCALFYLPTLKALLAGHEWKFCETIKPLINLGAGLGGWGYAYSYPPKCASVRAIIPEASLRSERHKSVDYKMMMMVDDQTLLESRIICTDTNNAFVRYTVLMENEDLFPPLFREAFTWSLAAALAMPITGKIEMVQYANEGVARSLPVAAAADANEASVNRYMNDIPSWLQAGGYGTETGITG